VNALRHENVQAGEVCRYRLKLAKVKYAPVRTGGKTTRLMCTATKHRYNWTSRSLVALQELKHTISARPSGRRSPSEPLRREQPVANRAPKRGLDWAVGVGGGPLKRGRFSRQPWIQRKRRGVFGVIKVVELKTKPLSGRTGTQHSTVTGSGTNRGPLAIGVLL
jgi:hypothetical protein